MSSLYVDTIRNKDGNGAPVFDRGIVISGIITTSGSIGGNSVGIGSTTVIDSTFQLKNIASLDSVTLSTFETALQIAPNNFTSLNISGISTFAGNVFAQSDVTVTGSIGASRIAGVALSSSGFFYSSGISTALYLQGTHLNYSGISTISHPRGVNLDYSGISTLTNARGTSLYFSGISTADHLRSTTFNSTGVSTVTYLQGTNLNYSGISTIAIGILNSLTVNGISTLTNARGTSLYFSGISTADHLRSTTFNSTGVSTVTYLQGTNLNYSGISTIATGIVSSLTVNGISSISSNSLDPALKITQLGFGDALIVQDSANPDSSPFVIDYDGKVGAGISLPSQRLHIYDPSGDTAVLLDGDNEAKISLNQPQTDTSGFDLELINSYGTYYIRSYNRTTTEVNYPLYYESSNKQLSFQAGAYDVIKAYGDGTGSTRAVVIGDGQNGALTRTGTTDQNLQVKEGAYIGGNLGVGVTNPTLKFQVSGDALVSGIITASTRLSTGASGVGINITQNTISGPSEIVLDPSAIGNNTGAVRIAGDLYVDGSQFIVNSTTIELADFNVGIATTVATNALLDGAGIGIGSVGIRKTITWNNTAGALTSSEDWNLASGKQYEINGTAVLSSTTLGSGVVNSSLTSVGTLGSLSVNTNISANGNISGAGINAGFSTITTLSGTLLNYPSVFVRTGIITNSSGERLNYTGLSTVTHSRGTTLEYTGISTVTNIRGTTLSYSGFSTVTNINGTNLSYTGLSTISSLRGSSLEYTGVGTISQLNATTFTSGVSTFSGTVSYGGLIYEKAGGEVANLGAFPTGVTYTGGTDTLTINLAQSGLPTVIAGDTSGQIDIIEFTNAPTTGAYMLTLTLIVEGDTGGWDTGNVSITVNGGAPSNVLWKDGAQPVGVTTTNPGFDIVTFKIIRDSLGSFSVFADWNSYY